MTVTISRLKEQYIIGMNLHRLLSELIGLCAELHDIPPDGNPRPIRSQENLSGSSSNQEAQTQILPAGRGDEYVTDIEISRQTALPTPGQDEMASSGLSSFPGGQPGGQVFDDSATRSASIWGDGLMFELFNLQPSVEWLDIEGVDMVHGLQQ